MQSFIICFSENHTLMKTRHTLCGTGLWTVLFACLSLICTLHAQESSPWDGSIAKRYAGGSGTKEDPYLISNGSELARIHLCLIETPNDVRGQYFLQTKNIDLGEKSWTPIGLPGNAFNGHFDGNGFKIKKMLIDKADPSHINSSNETQHISLGLFGSVSSTGTVRNVQIDNSSKIIIRDIWDDVINHYINNGLATYSISFDVEIGSVVGHIDNTEGVHNCSSDASIDLDHNCNRDGHKVYCDLYIGGVFGFATSYTYVPSRVLSSSFHGDIKISTSTPNTLGYVNIGGVVGVAGIVIACQNNGTISFDASQGLDAQHTIYIGGIAGSGRNAAYCSNTGSINYCTNSTSGLIIKAAGILQYVVSDTILHCYNKGNILNPFYPNGNKAIDKAAGLSSAEDGYVGFSYSTGNISTSNIGVSGYLVCGNNRKTETAFYSNKAVVRGQHIISNGRSVSPEELKSKEILEELQAACPYWQADLDSSNDGFPVLNLMCSVSFDDGDSVIKTIEQPAYSYLREFDPKKPGYRFKAWYTDEARSQVFNFSSLITQNMTLYAGYHSVDWTKFSDTSFSGGEGTEETPYLIATAEQLAFLSKQSLEIPFVTQNKYYRLTADIDLAPLSMESFVPKEWVGIGGSGDFAFMGHFDGNGHTIKNMVNKKPFIVENINNAHNQTFYKGLFGYVQKGSIRNLNIENAILTEERAEDYPDASDNLIASNNLFLGTLAGYTNSSLISDCNIKQVNIHINHTLPYKHAFIYLGGLVGGANHSHFSNNTTYDSIIIDDIVLRNDVLTIYSGGLIGESQNNFIEEVSCHNYMNLTTQSQRSNYYPAFGMGGLVGCSTLDTLLFVVSTGKLLNNGYFTKSSCGGILGRHQTSLLRHVYSHVNIEGNVNAGGILGTTPSQMNANKSTLSSAYVTGNISGSPSGAIAPSQWSGIYPSPNTILYLESQNYYHYTNPAWQAVSENKLKSDTAVDMLNGTPSSHAFMKDMDNTNFGFPIFNTRTVTLSFETFNSRTIEPMQVLSRKYLNSCTPKTAIWEYADDENGLAVFQYWCTDAYLENEIHPDSIVGLEDRKLYAKFTTNIQFECAGDNYIPDESYTLGIAFNHSHFPTPSQSGYVFDKWYSDPSYRHAVHGSDPVRPYGTLYGRWRREVHFNALGGEPVQSRYYLMSYPYLAEDNPGLPTSEKPGYHFGGWYAEPLFTEQRFASDIVPLQPDTLYAVWGERVTVNFDSRGGSSVEPREYYPQRAYNAVYTLDGQRFNEGLPLNPTKEDAMFEGWFDESLQYQTRVNSTVPDSSHTLYAKWSEKVPVSFESNGGSTFENKEYWSGHPYNYTSFLPTPSKEGAIFVNWYDSPDFEQVVTAQSIVSEEAHTLYAKWSEPFAVSFETFGYCDPIDDYTYYPYYAYRNSYPRNPGLPTYFGNAAENTKSLGWYDSPDFSNQITEQSIVSPDVKTLYLKLSRAQTISFSSEYPCDESRSYYPGFAFRSSSNPGLPTSFRNTETGVYFIGWFTTSDYTEKITDESIVPADLYMLYAKWNRAQTIRFETFGGNTIDNRDYVPGFKYYDYSVSNTGLPTPTREGSYFLGWFTDESFSVQVENNSVVDENVHTLYAKWSTLLSVRFETFGGNTIDNRDYHSGRAFNASPNPGLPTPTKEEARFLGWFDAPDFSTQMTASDIVPENLHTLYAKWAEKTSCTFIDYRENRKENKEFYHNISYNTTPNTGFVRWTAQTTPVFIGWFAKLQKLQNPVRNTDTVPDKRDMTLFARWCVAVDFHTDGGNSLEKGLYEPGMLYGESPNEGLPKPYKAGFSFMGWFADQGLNTSVTDNSLVPDRDHALYAKWKGATIITVSFEMNGGVELSPKTFQADGLRYGDAPNTGLPLPTWVGHRFIGWFANQNLSEAVSDNTVVPSNNHTLYAKWEEDENPEITIVTVSFHTGNGTTVANRDYQADGLKYGEAPNPGLPTEAQTGQGLIGWFADQNLTEAVSNNTVVPTHDHTLYAKWKQGTDAETRNKASLRVYPNPTTGCFFIETTETLVSVELFHQDGRLLRCWKGTEEKMSLEGLSSGLYLLRITTENGILQERLVKF